MELVEGDVIPADELSALLTSAFGHARIQAGSREVVYTDADENVFLRLRYSRAGAVSASAEAALADEIAKALIDQIETLSQGGAPTLWREVAFAALPVEGYWRYADEWQIRAVPADAPRPPFLMAPQPFLIEVVTGSLPGSMVGWMRARKVLREIELILALLLQGGITAPDHSAAHEWVIEPEPEPHSELRQRGYWLTPASDPTDVLPDPVGLPALESVPAAHYFNRLGIGVGDVLAVPDITAETVETIARLDPPSREKFFRAAYWFSRSRPAWHVSQSLSYISLINSIEVLADRAGPDPCPTCGLDRAPGPTARFRDTVERFVGDVPGRKELYQARSRLVHGDQLLHADGPEAWAFAPQPSEERDRHGVAQDVARLVILGWLFAQ